MSYRGVSVNEFAGLRARMCNMKIYEKDIKEQFVRASGPGGQNINKVATCVHLQHIPTGIRVKCQKERTQGRNRFMARRILLKTIERNEERERRQKIQQIQKMRRQKRKLSRKSKEEMLLEKRRKSQVKQNRRRINVQNVEKYL